MSNIVNFNEYKKDSYDTESWGYMEFDTKEDIGVGSKYVDISIHRSDNDNIYINLLGESYDVDRKGLAEFLWAAAYLLDSDEEWVLDKYVGLDK